MPHYIVKIDKWYFDWSTVVDAPVTYGMTLEGLKEWYRFEFGEQGMKDLPERLERVEKHGTSAIPSQTVDQLITFNRAGDNEENLSKEMIVEKYVLTEDEES